MDRERQSSSPASPFVHRVDAFGSVGEFVSEFLMGLITFASGKALSGGLRLMRLCVIFSLLVVCATGTLCFIADSGVVPVLLPGLSRWVEAELGTPLSSSLDVIRAEVDGAACLLPILFVLLISVVTVFVTWAGPGGSAWSPVRLRSRRGIRIAPGPAGLPIIGCAKEMQGNAHRKLAALSLKHDADKLMAFSVGCTRVVITSDPAIARDMLMSSAFAERPLKQAAEKLLFERAMGFAAPGPYWRRLRRIAATSLFCPKQITAHRQVRYEETSLMVEAIFNASTTKLNGSLFSEARPVRVRSFLQRAAVNNMMRIVFGRRFDFGDQCSEACHLEQMIRECFDVLGAFNWSDHFPGLRHLEMFDVGTKCANLVPRVRDFVQKIIDDHRSSPSRTGNELDFVDVLLNLSGEDKMSDSDMVSVLWELIFRGTDTIAVLTEWALAEVVLHPEWQKKMQDELDAVVEHGRLVVDEDVENLPSLQAFVKETLRVHPPGPLLSWARMAVEDVKLGGFDVPKGTTAMVNMWAITHNHEIWEDPEKFNPSRFLCNEGGLDVDVRGGDLRLAPFGAGRRVCPGRSLGMVTSHLWLARLLQAFSWASSPAHPVDLAEELKLSCEMANCLRVIPSRRPSIQLCGTNL